MGGAETGFERASLRLLLDRLGKVGDPREPCKVKYPLGEVLFLFTCATMAGCDDYDEIALWGRHHLAFLRGYSEYPFETPKEDWLRTVINRIDPELFEACFTGWALSLRPDAPDLIALDGKSLRRSGDGRTGAKPLHLVSAWAEQPAGSAKRSLVDGLRRGRRSASSSPRSLWTSRSLWTRRRTNAPRCWPSWSGSTSRVRSSRSTPSRPTRPWRTRSPAGAPTTCSPSSATRWRCRNQMALHREVEAFFSDPATTGIETAREVDKDHGRLETRTTGVSHETGWITGSRRHPGEPRFPGLATLVRSTTRSESRGRTSEQTRYFISSARLSPAEAASAVRSHWGIESLHWVLDVVFKEDLSRLRRGHGARNMALVRRFAFNIVRAGRGKTSIKTARKAAGWSPDFLASLINTTR